MSREIEEWRPIQGYEGLYEVSDWGRVKSLKRGKCRILKPYKDKDGYLNVGLHKDGKQLTVQVHRLVAEAFLENKDSKPQVDHINSVRHDNRANNLRWATIQENVSTEHARCLKSQMAYNRKDNKRKIRQYSFDGEPLREFNSLREIERELGFDCSSIIRVCKGKQYTSYGYKWGYMD